MFLFVFRSIMFTEATGECRLAAMDRHSLAGRPGFGPAPGVQYMEVNCVSDPSKWVRKIYIIHGDLQYLRRILYKCLLKTKNAIQQKQQ